MFVYCVSMKCACSVTKLKAVFGLQGYCVATGFQKQNISILLYSAIVVFVYTSDVMM